MLKYLFIALLVFGIGDIISTITKAKISSVFVVMVLYLVLFLTDAIPDNIIELAGLTSIGKWGLPFVIFHMGTMFNLSDIKREWRTVAVSMLSLFAAILSAIVVMPIIGRDYSIVSIPVINGGIVATNIMAEGALNKGLEMASALAVVIYSVQKFFGAPIAARYGLKAASDILDAHRNNVEVPYIYVDKKGESNKKRFFEKHSKFYGNFTCFTIVAFFSYLSFELGEITVVPYSIWAFLFGVVSGNTGVVPDKILDRSKASGLLNMAIFTTIIPSLATIEISQLYELGMVTLALFASLLIFIFLIIYLLPTWKIIGNKNLCMGIAVAQLLGFPATYLIASEVSNAVGENDEEKNLLMEVILPKYVIAGLFTVTGFSVIVAGILVNFL